LATSDRLYGGLVIESMPPGALAFETTQSDPLLTAEQRHLRVNRVLEAIPEVKKVSVVVREAGECRYPIHGKEEGGSEDQQGWKQGTGNSLYGSENQPMEDCGSSGV